MDFRITIRYGGARHRYHTFVVEADDAQDALREAAERVPAEVAPDADLVELRVAVDPDARAYLEEE